MTKSTKTDRENIHNKFEGRCAYCGDRVEFKKMQVDHILSKKNFKMHIEHDWCVPFFLKHLTVNDLNHNDNLFPACRVCNKRKDTMDIETFRAELQLQLLRAQNTSANYRMAKKYKQVIETPKRIIFHFEKYFKR